MPTTDAFEESKISLLARATNEKWLGKTVDFTIAQTGNGAAVPNHSGTFIGFTCRYDINNVPRVHDDEASYLLEYTVTVEGKARRANNKYRVWPSLYEIEGELQDGTPAKLCNFQVSGGDCRGQVTLDNTGKGQYEPRTPGSAPAFEVLSPYELVSWDQTVGRNRKATLRRKPYTAQFYSPAYADIPRGLQFVSTLAPSGQGFYQVVNLNDPATVHYGTSIRFKVGAQGDLRREPAARLGQKDDEIHVKVEFQPTNSDRNDDPKPGVEHTVGGPLVEAHTTATQNFTVALGDDGAGGEFKVVCGHAGDDKILVSIGVTPACQDASYEIVTRRRVFYQVTRNTGQANPNLAGSEAALADVGVKLSRYKIKSLAPGDEPGGGAISWLPGAYFGKTTPQLNVGNYNKVYYHNFWTNQDPRGIVVAPRFHLLYTDAQYDSYDPAVTGHNDDFVEVAGQEMTSADLIDWQAGPQVVGIKLDLPMKDAGLFSQRLYNGGDPFIRGEWKVKSEAIQGAFSTADVWLATDHLSVKLPAACAVHLGAGKTIVIRTLLLARARGPYLGEAANNKILCVVTQSNAEINNTLTHEIGHVMDLVAAACPPGMNLANHTRKYVGNNHLGGHCAKGMAGGDYNNGAGAGTYAANFAGKGECICVMYGEGNPASTGAFCDLCTPFAKGAKVD